MTGPFNTRSGYGDHARSIFYALEETGLYEMHVLDVRWGNTPRNFLDPTNEKDAKLLDKFLPQPELSRQPDIHIDVRIPNEFETHGKVNIGVTAGIETNIVSRKWIEGANRMDLVIVPSEHSKQSFLQTVYDAMETLPDGTQRKSHELKVEKPIEVVFEGMDTNVYKPLKLKELKTPLSGEVSDIIPEQFAFLHVGQWNQGGFGEDRKDIGRLCKIFLESFANQKKQPALILKTSGAGFSHLDHTDIKKKIRTVKKSFPLDWKLPKIYLLHGDLSEEELNELYNHPKVKAFVSLTHGEGFGRPLLEASLAGLPVIASGWSGQMDFLDDKLSWLIPGKLNQVPEGVVWEDIIVKESQWFTVDEHEAYKVLTYAFEKNNYYQMKNKAQSLQRINSEKYTLANMNKMVADLVAKYSENIAVQKSITLPQLKKSATPAPKVKLPKLTKMS